MKIALFEASQMMRDLTMSAIDISELEWDQFEYFGEKGVSALSLISYDAIITSKEFSHGTIEDIIKFAQKSSKNRETPIFLFTSDNTRICIDTAFDIGITDIFYKQELAVLADTLRRINQFSHCVKGAHVLLVEDNPSVSRVFAHVLGNLNCNVHLAADCDLAISILDKFPIELVVTDLNLQEGGQGQRIIRSMRHCKKLILNQIPIMVMSACNSAQSQTGLFFLGIDDYVVKPVLPMQFSLRAVNLIKKYRVFQQTQNQAAELQKIAHFDNLTKVYNRHGFEDIAKFCVANCQRQVDSTIGIMYIDLDNFKLVNDTLGHAKGDDVLIQITDLLKVELRDQDIIARWGGDEFVVLLNQCDVRFIMAICERIISRINDNRSELHDVSCSIGLAYGKPESIDDVFSYIALADKDMYRKKNSQKISRQSN